MGPGPRSPNNKFIESGRKCQSKSRIKILVYSVKRKELHAHTCKKYSRTCPSTGTKSYEFFFFTVVFLQPFALFFSFFFFFSLFSLFSVCVPLFSLSLYYILWFLHHFLNPRVGQVLGVLSLLPLPLLEPFILSCKAACSLFRHHLHINAARELVGQQLMRGQQYFQIFVFSHSYPLSDIFSSPLLQGLSETLP